MKKILMLLDNPFVSDQRVEKEARSLIQNGFDVTVFATSGKGLPASEVRLGGITVSRVFSHFFLHPLRIGYQRQLQEAADLVAGFGADIIHCHDFHMLEIGVQAKLKRPDIFLCYDAHEYLRGWPFYRDIRPPFNRLKGWLTYRYLLYRERMNARRADAVIATTEAIAKALAKDNGLPIQPLVIGNIPNLVPQNKPENNLRTMFHIPADTVVMVQSGNINQSDPELKALFDAVLNMDRLALVLIGNRPRFYEVRDKTRGEKKYHDKIFFAEYATEKLHDMISSADFGLMFKGDRLSQKLASPNRFFEYSLCGIPTLSVQQDTVREFNTRYNCAVLFDRGSSDALKKGIRSMLDALEEKTAGARSMKLAFSWEHEVKKLIDLYQRLPRE